MPAAPSDADVIALAEAYNLPPAILMGMSRAAGASTTYNLQPGTLSAYSLTPEAVAADPLLGLEIAARTLAQGFGQYNSWEQAISYYLSGDPLAYQSTTSSVAGQVYNVLGSAATDPSFGLQGLQPANAVEFDAMANAFGNHLDSLVSSGGIVSPQSVQQYRRGVSTVAVGNIPYRQDASLRQAMTDILHAAGLPLTQANLALLTTMARGEGMDPSSYNWLASTEDGPSVGTVPNTPGVKMYASYRDGIAASAQTLLNGHYDRMVAMMRSGADLHSIAHDPGAQADLRTWQGGSSEDVNNLLQLANVPGRAAPDVRGSPSGAATPSPDPQHVGEFAAQLQGMGISPQDFSRYFPTLAARRRELLQAGSTVSDFGEMATAVRQQAVPLSEAAITAHVRALPHPKYPSITVGAFHDGFNHAMLHSVLHDSSIPSESEAARLVMSGAGWKEYDAYYRNKAAQRNPTAQPAPQQTGGDSGKIVQLGRSA